MVTEVGRQLVGPELELKPYTAQARNIEPPPPVNVAGANVDITVDRRLKVVIRYLHVCVHAHCKMIN